MDLHEHGLNEDARRLRRLGVTHVWREPVAPERLAQHHASAPQQAPNSSPAPTPDPTPPSPFHGKHQPSKTLWLYPQYGADLAQDHVPPRLEVLRLIQQSVQTHLHWPARDIATCDVPSCAQHCMDMLACYAPHVLLCFGSTAAAVLTDFANTLPTAPQIIALPDLDRMAEGDKASKNAAWKILKELHVRF